MENISFYNTLSGKKEVFTPITGGKVGIYACGVTTYDHYHIGHALQAIYFDVLRNFLDHIGFDVCYVRNYTDVDDKIIARAKEQGISPAVLAENMIASSEEDMVALGCQSPDFSPRVSECIPEIIAMIEVLVENESAYATKDGDVYYRVRKKKDYGKLSNRKVDELEGEREIISGDKEDALDFALWKSDETPDASWESPWGVGRPGWHIECSVMSKKHLGNTFDIHGGGRDLVFPHHENEIAQSESANGCPYAHIWLHSGLLTIEHQKMSKSIGNHISVKEFIKKWPAETLRLAFLQHHYRSNIDFKNDTFAQANARLCYFYETIRSLDDLAGDVTSQSDFEHIREKFKKAMSDDFNTAVAYGELNIAFKKANELMKGKQSPDKKQTAADASFSFKETLSVFGIHYNPEKLCEIYDLMLSYKGISREHVEKKICERAEARKNKDYAMSDKIRDELLAQGIELCDTKEGCEFRVKLSD